MSADAKLEIILAAQNASRQAFSEYKRDLASVGQSFGQLKNMIGGLVGAGGVLMAVRTGFEAMFDGVAAQKQAMAFGNLAASVNANSGQILADLKKVSGGFVGESELIKAAGTAMMMGLQPAELTKMMKIAEATSRQTGQSVTEAFDDITRGVARQSKMILDNLGIIVDVEKANERYAKQLGKTSEALTDAEKRQAFMNEVMAKGDELIKRIGNSGGAYDNINKLAAKHSDLWSEAGTTIANIVERNMPLYLRLLDGVTEKLKQINAGAEGAIRADLLRKIEQARKFESLPWGPVLGKSWTGDSAALEREFMERFQDPKRKLFTARGGYDIKSNEWRGASSWREREGQYGDLTEDEKKAIIAKRDEFLKQQKDQAKKAADESKAQLKALTDEVVKYQEDFQMALMGGSRLDEFMAGGQNENAISRMHQERQATLLKEAEKQQSEAMLADQRVYDEWKRKNEESFNFLTELSEHTAESMQDNFSDLFFDAYKGKLNDWQDYTQAVFDSILKAWSDLQGQMLTQAIFGNKAVGGTQGGGGIVGWLSKLFSGGGPEQLGQYNENAKGNVFGENGVERFGSGGVVTRPTVFPFARGIGLMGEAGAEAIMPLKRMPGGRLGVEAAGQAAGVTVTVNNYTGQQVETREARGPSGQREIEIMVGQALAKDGPASRALSQRYGINRRGIMR